MSKKHTVISIIFFLAPVILTAQPVDIQMMQKIRDEEKNNSQIVMIAHNLTDVTGPRLTNSPGYKRALVWITQTLNQWGLQNAGPEAWGEFGKGWSTEKSYLALKAPYYQPMIAYPVAWSNGTKKPLTADVILIDKLDSATIGKLGKGVKDKVVMTKTVSTTLRSAMKPFYTRYEDTALQHLPDEYMLTKVQIDNFVPFLTGQYRTKLYLQSLGALGLLSSGSQGRDGTIVVSGSPARAKGYEAALPELVIDREDYLRLQRLIQNNKKVQVEMDVRNRFYNSCI